MSSLDTHAKRIAELTNKLEKSVKAQKFLMEQNSELQELLLSEEEKNVKITREKEGLSRWVKAYKAGIADYEDCLREMGILDPSIDMSVDTVHLKPHIKRLIRQLDGFDDFNERAKIRATSI